MATLKDHVFVGAADEDGFPVLKQVPGASEGAMSQVCLCGGQAAEDGTTPDHLLDIPENFDKRP